MILTLSEWYFPVNCIQRQGLTNGIYNNPRHLNGEFAFQTSKHKNKWAGDIIFANRKYLDISTNNSINSLIYTHDTFCIKVVLVSTWNDVGRAYTDYKCKKKTYQNKIYYKVQSIDKFVVQFVQPQQLIP